MSSSRSRLSRYLWVAALSLISWALAARLESNGRLPDRDAVSRADQGVVARIIDGDTIELADGRTVRFIGIDTPEVRHRRGGRWVDDPEPFAREASHATAALMARRTVRLEFDVQPRDKYGRTLAYVYVAEPDGHELMVNEELVRLGAAQLMTIPPNVRYVERFRQAQDDARRAQRGVWGEAN